MTTNGIWYPSATKTTYQWFLNGHPLWHATTARLLLLKAWKGEHLTCLVTALHLHAAPASALTPAILIK